MIRIFIYIILAHMYCTGFAHAQVKLYTVNSGSDFGPEGRRFMSANKVEHIKIIHHHLIDPDNNGMVNLDVLTRAINELIPNPSDTSICVLDWEGAQFEYLKFSPVLQDSAVRVVSKFRALLQFARTMRPKAKWGIYDIPVSTYWVKQDTSWNKRIDVLTPLLREVDFFAPSLYDYFQTGQYPWMDDEAYIEQTIVRSLRLGSQYGKPVLPFIWHRYHNATEKVGFACINPAEFRAHIAAMLKQRIAGKGIAGLIWWQADKYYYQVAEPVFLKEAKGMTINKYLDTVVLRYGTILTSLLAGEETGR